MKIIRTITTAMLSLLALAACNNEEILPDRAADSDGSKIRITATMGDFTSEDGAPGTRASINDDGAGTFGSGDKITFYTTIEKDGTQATPSNTAITLTYNGSSWSSTGCMWDDLVRKENEYCLFTAFYNPDGTVVSPDGNNAIVFSVKQDQSLAENYKASDLLFAEAKYASGENYPVNGTLALPFTHKMARIKITLQGDKAAQATVTSINNMATGCKMDFRGTLKEVSTNKDITPKQADDGSRTFYALVPPQAISNLSLTLMVDGKTVSHTVTMSEKTLLPNKEFSIVLKLKESGDVL